MTKIEAMVVVSNLIIFALEYPELWVIFKRDNPNAVDELKRRL